MASRFSSVRQFMENKANQNREDRSVDSLIKQAQLKELGYDYQPRSKALGIFGGGADIVQNPNYVSTKDYERQKLFGEIQKGDLERKKLEQEIGGFGQALPDGFVRVQGKVMKDPNFMTPYQRSRSGGDSLTPGQRLAKDKATKEIFESVEMNKARKSTLDKASEGSKNIPKGFFGKVRVDLAQSQPWTKGMVGVTDTQIQDAQEMKMALTMGTLAETAFTKGAISDKEMFEFKRASSNNDYNSPAVVPVLEKIRRFADAQDAGLFGAYKQNYGEDPRDWFGASAQPEFGNVQQEEGGVPEVPEWAVGKIDYPKAKADGFTDEQIKEYLIAKGLA